MESSLTGDDRPAPVVAALVSIVLLGAVTGVPAGELVLNVQQGTRISAVPGGDGHLVTDLAGRLWNLPESGGTATPLTEPGTFARRPRRSPDGGTLAYETLLDGHFQVMLMDATGGNPRAATRGPWHHLAPAWSPDGGRLAFSSNRGGDFSIWVLDLQTQALRQASFEPGDELDPAWNPADGAIAYVSDWGGRSSLVLSSEGRTPRTLVSGGQPLRGPSWRPDGGVISYVAELPRGPRLNMAILSTPPVIKPAGGTEEVFPVPATWLDGNRLLYTGEGQIRIRELAADPSTDVPFEASLSLDPASDPPRRQLAAVSGAQPVRGLGGISVLSNGHVIVSALGDLWEVDQQGAQLRRLTMDANIDRDPAASADGRWLAFSSDRDGSPQVWLMQLATGQTRQLTAEPGYAGRPAWNAAGDRLAYLAGEPGKVNGGSFSLKIIPVPADGRDWKNEKPLQVAGGLVEPGTPAWSPDGSRLGMVQMPQGQPQLLLLSADGTPDGSHARRMTLPIGAVGPGSNDAQWSPDGKSLLVASSAGIRTLPVLASGLVGADWRTLSDQPAQLARWIPGQDAVLFTDARGLGKAGPADAVSRIPLAISWQPAEATGTTIIRASRVLDPGGKGYLFDHEVVIQGDRIQSVRLWTGSDEGATIIDARGKTVLPGLIDLAVQLSDPSGGRRGRTLLAFGITTVQVTDMAGTELREVTERWLPHGAGPRLLRSPQWCGEGPVAPGAVAGVTDGGLRLCPTALGQLRDLTEPLHLAGAVVWSPSWIAALSGLVHVVSPGLVAAPAPVLEASQSTAGYYQDAIDVMARSGVVLVPALAPSGMAFLAQEQPDLLASRPYLAHYGAGERAALADAWEAAAWREGATGRSRLRQRQRALGRLVAGGGRLATASNSPAVPYGLGLHAEIRLLADIGLGNEEILGMATAQAARAVGLQDEIGRIAPGLLADLVIINGDPLYDLGQLLRIDSVMTGGRLHPIGELLPDVRQPLEKFTATPGQPGP